MCKIYIIKLLVSLQLVLYFSNSSIASCREKHAMVSTTHPLATQVGLDILKKGGNAFDAAIAVQFALAVVYPRAGNIGGGGFMTYRKPNGESGCLDFRETASKNACNDMYIQEGGRVDVQSSLLGVFSAATPGTVDGMVKMHEKLSILPWEEVLKPAIDLAKDGFALDESEANEINKYQKTFEKVNRWKLPMQRNSPWQKGDTIKFTRLANTLKLISEHKREGFYSGKTAHALIEEMRLQGGIICQEDLNDYEAKWRNPIEWKFRNYNLITMPPPSSGGISLSQLLHGWETRFNKKWKHNGKESIHLMTELARYVYADRCSYLGDSDFIDFPIDKLLSKSYLEERYAKISSEKEDSQAVKKGNISTIESIETTHFSIVDTYGNAVGVTTTLNSYYGCKVMVKDAGFFLNNVMNDFCLCPGTANQFGLVESEANAINANKRMLSSMCPSILEKDGDLFMVVGTPGGSTIITCIFQAIVNVIDFNMNMQEAINAGKTHAQWLPDEILVEENRIPTNVIEELKELGHDIRVVPKLGKMDCILKHSDGTLEGATDIRGEGLADGF